MASNFDSKTLVLNENSKYRVTDKKITLLNQADTTNKYQLNTLEATQAIKTDYSLTSNLLTYETVYKPPVKEVFTAIKTEPEATVDHIDPLSGVLSQVIASLGILQDDLGKTQTDASLYGKTRAFVTKYSGDEDVTRILASEISSAGQLKNFNTLFAANLTAPADDKASELFHNGRVLLKETQKVRSLHDKLLQLQRVKLKKLIAMRDEKKQLASQIAENKRHLDALNKDRLESLGDYALVQRLVDEDWSQVEEKFKQRKAILEAYTGLYYVRVRESPVGVNLKDAEPLRHFDSGDIVPGCADVETELPDDLSPFMEIVLDIPLSDWRILAKDRYLLPGRIRQKYMQEQRRQRLSIKIEHQRQQNTVRMLRLAPLLQTNVLLLSSFASRSFTQVGSVQQQFAVNYAALSLEDVLNGPRTLLNTKAQRLNKQLSQAVVCFLDILQAIQPSIRFRWAQRVEDGKLPLQQPERWPGLAEIKSRDLNTVRTLMELVDWFFRQLGDEAGDDSLTAMKQLLSACLLLAASEDPDQLLYGTLKTQPGIIKPGVMLRLDLNREALPGTQLQLLDASRKVIGSLRVDDQDEQGAVATVTHIASVMTTSTQYTVIGATRYGRTVL